jgi:hypothetical protein
LTSQRGNGADQLHPLARAVIVQGTENQEVYVTFSPPFEHIWMESKKRLPGYVAKEPANLALRSRYSIRLSFVSFISSLSQHIRGNNPSFKA